jgi:hypothetical protein
MYLLDTLKGALSYLLLGIGLLVVLIVGLSRKTKRK